jgi:hypothetical protein
MYTVVPVHIRPVWFENLHQLRSESSSPQCSGRQAVASLLQLTGIQGAAVNAATVPADPNRIQIVIVYP